MSDEVNKAEKSSEVKPEVKVYNSKKKVDKNVENDKKLEVKKEDNIENEVNSKKNVNVEEEIKEKKKSKEEKKRVTHSNDNISFIEKDRRKWPIVLLLVLLVLGGAFYYYYYILTKPSTLFNNVIESGYDYLSNSINKLNDKTNENKKYEMTGKAILTSSNLKLIAFNTLTTDVYVGVDEEKGSVFTDLRGSLLNIDILNLKLGMDKENIYFGYNDMSEGAQDKLYKTKNIELEDDSLRVDDTDYNEILNSIKYLIDSNKETILSSVENAKVSKKPMMLKVDDKSIPAYKVKYISSKENTKKAVTTILNNIINDQKSLEALVTLGYGEDSEKLKVLLEEQVKDVNITDDLEIVVYLDILNNKLLEFNTKYGSEKLNIKFNENDVVVLLENKNANEENLSISITYNKVENRVALEYVSRVYDEGLKEFDDIKGSITLKVDSSSDSKSSYTISFKYYDPDNTDKELFCIDANIDLERVNEIKEFDTTNVIDFDKLSEEEKSKIIDDISGFEEEA